MKRNKKGQFVQDELSLKHDGYSVYFDAKGYPIIWFAGKEIKLHIYVWEKENGPKPKGLQLHHKDFNKGNYNLSNLELVTQSDHFKIHAGWVQEKGKWIKKPCTSCDKILPLKDFYKRKGYTPTAKCKKCHCKETKKWATKNPEKRKRIANAYYHRNKKGGSNLGESQEV